MLTLNSDYIYETWLGEYPYLLRDLTRTYGGPPLKKFLEKRGRRMLIDILKHLTNQKQCTCEVIAQEKFNKIRKEKRKLKSLTDDVRKFIQKNLIPRRVVVVDGTKKVYNKDVTAYSLTPFGILYSIHFFSKQKNISEIINNLSIEYMKVLPNVFGKFESFKVALGDDFIKILGLQRVANGNTSPTFISRGAIAALGNFVNLVHGVWMRDIFYLPDRWVNQISLCVYNNIMSNLHNDAEMEFIVGGQKGNVDDLIKKRITKFWKIISEGEPEIKKWYQEYLEEALVANEDDARGLREAEDWLK